MSLDTSRTIASIYFKQGNAFTLISELKPAIQKYRACAEILKFNLLKHLTEVEKSHFEFDTNWLEALKIYSDEGMEFKDLLIDVLNKISESEVGLN